MNVDIIIPSYNQLIYTLTCLESIRYWSSDYRLIFVDNGSDKNILEEVEEELDRHRKVTLVKNRRNLGFVKAINTGLSLSTAPYIVLLNNDTEVTRDWLQRLQYPFTQNRQIRAVGPVTNAEGCWQGQHPVKNSWMLCSQTTMLAFFCVMLDRKVIEEVGVLDEQFGVGLADDDDYCRRIHLAGGRVALAESCYVYHAHRRTFTLLYSPDQIEEMTEKGLALFREKYGVDRKGYPIYK